MLHKMKVKVHLHCFHYGRKFPKELERLCKSIHYYKRKANFMSQLSRKPYIIKSRRDDKLIKNLSNDLFPIILEGLHSTYHIKNKLFRDKRVFIRAHNIEHHYYYNLAKNDKNVIRKLFFIIEAIKLKLYERKIRRFNILAISHNDYEYLNRRGFSVNYLPAFHPYNEISCLPGKGKYVLYHGNLSVSENVQALTFLVDEVFQDLDIPVVIAGKDPEPTIKEKIQQLKNVKLIKNPRSEQIFDLVRNAHINILPTFQPTGIKLKLINALFNGRFCLVNSPMVENTGLEKLCIIKDSAKEMKEEILTLFKTSFEEKYINQRKKILLNSFSNDKNAESLINLLF